MESQKVEQIKTKNKNKILHKSYVFVTWFSFVQNFAKISIFFFSNSQKLSAFVGILVVKFWEINL